MKLGTIVHDNEIYNLDYMTSDDIKELSNKVEQDKRQNLMNAKGSIGEIKNK